jgi:hypothetical protein
MIWYLSNLFFSILKVSTWNSNNCFIGNAPIIRFVHPRTGLTCLARTPLVSCCAPMYLTPHTVALDSPCTLRLAGRIGPASARVHLTPRAAHTCPCLTPSVARRLRLTLHSPTPASTFVGRQQVDEHMLQSYVSCVSYICCICFI